MQIALPKPSKLSQQEQFVLLRKVENPPPEMLLRRAQLAIGLDRFEDARADLEAIPAHHRTPLAAITHAHVLRELADDADGLAAALALLEPIDAESLPGELRVGLRLELASCLRALGDVDRAIAELQQALADSPTNQKVLRKLVALLFETGRPATALQVSEELLRQGIARTRVIGSAFTAMAALGRHEEAIALRGLDRFLSIDCLRDKDLPALHAEVEQQLRAHPALRFGNRTQASEGSWRLDELALREQAAVTTLLQRIVRRIETFVEHLRAQPDPHPWLGQMPERAQMAAWALIAPAKGRETWHTHDAGWLSGVYYLKVPQSLPRGSNPAGAIEFGWTEKLLDDETRARLPARIVHPEEGMLLLFPSHVHHRTFAHGQDADRICIAFDVMPIT